MGKWAFRGEDSYLAGARTVAGNLGVDIVVSVWHATGSDSSEGPVTLAIE